METRALHSLKDLSRVQDVDSFSDNGVWDMGDMGDNNHHITGKCLLLVLMPNTL